MLVNSNLVNSNFQFQNSAKARIGINVKKISIIQTKFLSLWLIRTKKKKTIPQFNFFLFNGENTCCVCYFVP